MQMINLELEGKFLRFVDSECNRITVVGDNIDYFIHFAIKDRRKAMLAMFARGGREEAVLIGEDDCVNIPLWLLKKGSFEVGIISDGFASDRYV